MDPRIATLAGVLVLAAPALAGDERAIREVFASVERAVRDRDKATLIDSATENHLMISKNGETVVGKAALAAYLDKMIGYAPSIKSLQSTVEMSPDIRYYGEIAVTHGHSQDHYAFADGLELELTIFWTATVARDTERWRIAAVHYSFNLFDNGMLDAAYRGAFVAATGGALAGLSAGLLFFRRRPIYLSRISAGCPNNSFSRSTRGPGDER
ncbi:MAG: nuclear transport factor 2 family protein [Candidatus Accumulibacter phosphatis]|nr:nuclear transport factor 2 family protein [Candidatus Accumulibacter phosphatis]